METGIPMERMKGKTLALLIPSNYGNEQENIMRIVDLPGDWPQRIYIVEDDDVKISLYSKVDDDYTECNRSTQERAQSPGWWC